MKLQRSWLPFIERWIIKFAKMKIKKNHQRKTAHQAPPPQNFSLGVVAGALNIVEIRIARVNAEMRQGGKYHCAVEKAIEQLK